MSQSRDVRRFEGKVAIKGFTIAYILWIPFIENEFSFNESPIYDAIDTSMDPVSITSFFEETVVCFHGWLDNAASFSAIAPKLCNEMNFRVISFDLPGHGKSSHSPLGYYDLIMYSTSIIQTLHKLRLHSFHIMAHSLSAITMPYIVPVMEQSKLFNVKSMICIEQLGSMYSYVNLEMASDRMKRMDAIKSDILNENNNDNTRQLPKLYNSIDELVRSRIYVTEEIYPGNQSIGEKSARAILERNVGRIVVVESGSRNKSIKYYLRVDPKLKRTGRNPMMAIFVSDTKQMAKRIIPKIECPLLGLFGDKGWPALDRVAREMDQKNLMNNLTIVRMKGSHHLHLDDPDGVMANIKPFLVKAIELANSKTDTNGKSPNKTSKL